jgi:hypothetical protein
MGALIEQFLFFQAALTVKLGPGLGPEPFQTFSVFLDRQQLLYFFPPPGFHVSPFFLQAADFGVQDRYVFQIEGLGPHSPVGRNRFQFRQLHPDLGLEDHDPSPEGHGLLGQGHQFSPQGLFLFLFDFQEPLQSPDKFFHLSNLSANSPAESIFPVRARVWILPFF